jgi:GMP synthase (glutamine-hydrolysing)
MESLCRFDLYDNVWQCPTKLVPLSFTDVPGEAVIVRPIRSQPAMTATPVDLPSQLVSELRDQILQLNGVTGLARDITSKPPGTIEWE